MCVYDRRSRALKCITVSFDISLVDANCHSFIGPLTLVLMFDITVELGGIDFDFGIIQVKGYDFLVPVKDGY